MALDPHNLPEMDPKAVRLFFYHNQKYMIPTQEIDWLNYLNEFPLETIMVLLKNGFPTIIQGDLFFLKSLHQLGPDLTDPSFLHWLDFILDLSNRYHVNLNHINHSTRETILHEAIRDNNLALVQKILIHKADPNAENDDGLSPIDLAIRLYNESKSRNYLFIIRHLHRYGAKTDYQKASREIQRELDSGSRIPPIYYPSTANYLSLDRLEDISLILIENPKLISEIRSPGINMKELERSIQHERSKVKLYTWPLYIDDTLMPICAPDIDDRPTAASPPNHREVYRKVLAGLSNQKDISQRKRALAQKSFPEGYDASIPQIGLEISATTRPLPGRPIMPSRNPRLPSF